MWTTENRGRHGRSKLRYPGDLTDDEWALVEALIPPAKRGGNKRTVNVREVVNGIMYVPSTGCQWAALPKNLPPRSTVTGQGLGAPEPERVCLPALGLSQAHGPKALPNNEMFVDGL